MLTTSWWSVPHYTYTLQPHPILCNFFYGGWPCVHHTISWLKTGCVYPTGICNVPFLENPGTHNNTPPNKKIYVRLSWVNNYYNPRFLYLYRFEWHSVNTRVNIFSIKYMFAIYNDTTIYVYTYYSSLLRYTGYVYIIICMYLSWEIYKLHMRYTYKAYQHDT